jgi:hypothetical protein
MTAREEAKVLARKKAQSKSIATYVGHAEMGVDVASDVFEPLLDDAYAYRSRTTPSHIVKRMEEALGL